MSDERRNIEGLRLFLAEVSFEFVVAAHDERGAQEVAEQSMGDALEGHGARNALFGIRPATDPARIPDEWEDSIPYSDDDANPTDLTCAEILADPPAPTDAELEAAGQQVLL